MYAAAAWLHAWVNGTQHLADLIEIGCCGLCEQTASRPPALQAVARAAVEDADVLALDPEPGFVAMALHAGRGLQMPRGRGRPSQWAEVVSALAAALHAEQAMSWADAFAAAKTMPGLPAARPAPVADDDEAALPAVPPESDDADDDEEPVGADTEGELT